MSLPTAPGALKVRPVRTVNPAALGRIFSRLRRRWFDYSGLRESRSAGEVLTWARGRPHLDLFNGNAMRARIVQGVMETAGCNLFVETGTYHASTTIGARLYFRQRVVSCENSPREHYRSRLWTLGMRGITLHREDSPAFLRRVTSGIETNHTMPFFYLDAHEGALDPSSLPLIDEIRPILALSQFAVLVDDLRVPDDDGFLWGTYGPVALEIGLLSEGLRAAGINRCFFPAYSPTTETGRPSGYCLFWRSTALDRASQARQFPFDQLRPYSLPSGP
jgi:hypothetical protein